MSAKFDYLALIENFLKNEYYCIICVCVYVYLFVYVCM